MVIIPSDTPSPQDGAKDFAAELKPQSAPCPVCVCRVLVCLPVCGFVSGNRARLARAADSGVLRPTRPRFRFGLTRAPHESPTSGGYRRIHIRRRVAVLRDSSHFRGFRHAVGGEASRANRPFTTVLRGLSPVVHAFQRSPRGQSGSGSRCLGRAWGCR